MLASTSAAGRSSRSSAASNGSARRGAAAIAAGESPRSSAPLRFACELRRERASEGRTGGEKRTRVVDGGAGCDRIGYPLPFFFLANADWAADAVKHLPLLFSLPVALEYFGARLFLGTENCFGRFLSHPRDEATLERSDVLFRFGLLKLLQLQATVLLIKGAN